MVVVGMFKDQIATAESFFFSLLISRVGSQPSVHPANLDLTLAISILKKQILYVCDLLINDDIDPCDYTKTFSDS